MTHKATSEGFSLIGLVVIIAVIGIIGFGGWYVWHKNQEGKAGKTGTAQLGGKGTVGDTKPVATDKPAADPYAGWKTYCDSYSYCFKYPTDWKLTVTYTATRPCDVGQIILASPDGSVNINYLNDNNKDGTITTLTAISTTAPTSANQDLTIVGGYTPYGTQYLPSYGIADATLLRTYPIVPNQSTAFPSTPEFTDQGASSHTCQGSLVSQPTQASDTSIDAEAWFTTPLAQTSLQILKTFNYKR
jgi:hypothetical protein